MIGYRLPSFYIALQMKSHLDAIYLIRPLVTRDILFFCVSKLSVQMLLVFDNKICICSTLFRLMVEMKSSSVFSG